MFKSSRINYPKAVCEGRDKLCDIQNNSRMCFLLVPGLQMIFSKKFFSFYCQTNCISPTIEINGSRPILHCHVHYSFRKFSKKIRYPILTKNKYTEHHYSIITLCTTPAHITFHNFLFYPVVYEGWKILRRIWIKLRNLEVRKVQNYEQEFATFQNCLRNLFASLLLEIIYSVLRQREKDAIHFFQK